MSSHIKMVKILVRGNRGNLKSFVDEHLPNEEDVCIGKTNEKSSELSQLKYVFFIINEDGKHFGEKLQQCIDIVEHQNSLGEDAWLIYIRRIHE